MEETPQPTRSSPLLIPTQSQGKRSRENTFTFSPPQESFSKRLRFPTTQENPETANEQLEASLNYLLKAANAEQTKDRTEKILNLLSIFREFTNTGKIDYLKSILITQVKALENTSRTLNTSVRKLTIPYIPPQESLSKPLQRKGAPQSYATVTAQNSSLIPDGFTPVSIKRKPTQTSPPAPKPSPREHQISFPNRGLDKSFGPLAARTKLNKAFKNAGYRGKTIISGVRLSQNNNIVVTGNQGFPATFLLDKIAIIRKVFPDY